MIEFSIIVPIYNGEKHLKKCIKSILNQSFNRFELILVNDGSTDKSLQICEKYKKRDSRIRIINKKNEGSIKARGYGIEAATSEYIMFVDCDDWVNKRTLEIGYNNIKKTDIDVLVFNICKKIGKTGVISKANNSRYFDKDREYIGDEIKEKLATAYLCGHPFPASLCGKIYKKNILVESGNFLKYIEFFGDDLYYNLEVFLKIKKVKIIKNALYYYRFGGGTSRFMPYLFKDMTNGYKIQKMVVNNYYEESKEEYYRGISIMLLNTFKTCLSNLFLSNLDVNEIKTNMEQFVKNETIKEAIFNSGAQEYFDKEYLEAIQKENIQYIYQMAEKINNKDKYKRIAKRILSYI